MPGCLQAVKHLCLELHSVVSPQSPCLDAWGCWRAIKCRHVGPGSSGWQRLASKWDARAPPEGRKGGQTGPGPPWTAAQLSGRSRKHAFTLQTLSLQAGRGPRAPGSSPCREGPCHPGRPLLWERSVLTYRCPRGGRNRLDSFV